MKLLFSVLSVLLILGFSISCKKAKAPNTSQSISFAFNNNEIGDSLEMNPDGDVKKIKVKTDNPWVVEIANQDKWISLSANFGNENGTFSIVVDSNDTHSKRTGKLIFRNEGKIIASLFIVQNNHDSGSEKPDIGVPASLEPILNVIFNADGTAKDISSQKHKITTLAGFGMTTVYSKAFGRYIARFNHKPGGPSMSKGFYKYDYSNDNDFKNALSNGFTLETEFMLNVSHPLPDEEMKMFSSHQSGGTGVMIGRKNKGSSIIFLPHVGGKYIWVNSGVTPQQKKYYHVVGIWNKQEGKAFIYVNGSLKATKSTTGNFDFPSASSNWFGIGADPSGANANTAWKGDVVLARVYDKPLDRQEVESLWAKVAHITYPEDEKMLSGVSLSSKKVLLKEDYVIHGTGFQKNDQIKIESISGLGKGYLLDGEVSNSEIVIKIPTDFKTGEYRFYVVRDGEKIDIGFAKLTVVGTPPVLPKVIAHKGYWRSGTAENSVAALAKAQEIGVYGSEFDVHITKDGVVVIHHNATINGVNIEKANYSEIKDFTLSNGEKLPTFAQFLHQAKQNTNTRLICEIKKHSGSTGGINNNIRAAEKVVQMVQDSGLVDDVNYISFSKVACEKVHELLPDVSVAYLNGDLTPQQLHNKGLDMDYKITVLQQQPKWIAQAQNLGVEVNVWTVDSKSAQMEMINMGVDYITTNYPAQLQDILKNY